jgi:Putative zinc-finger
VSSVSPHPSDALLGLVYGELARDEAQRVQQHVDDCPECASTVDSYRAVRRAAAALPRELPSAAGLDSLLHYGAQAAARARRRRVALWTGSLLSGLAAAALLVLFLRPPGVPEGATATASAPPAVGALARNDVQVAGKPLGPEKPELDSEFSGARGGNGPAALSPRASAKAAPASTAADKRRARDEVAPAERPGPTVAAAEEARGPSLAQGTLSAPVAKRAAVVAGAQSSARAVAGAQLNAVAAPASPAAGVADVQAKPSSAAEKTADFGALPDAGGSAQRLRDEARRGVLLAKLEGASAQSALPLLSELCALEARLSHRADAARVCTRVVQQYPQTAEALAAKAQLEALPTP